MDRADGLVVAELLVVLAEARVVAGPGGAAGEVWLGGPSVRRTVHVAPAPTPGQLRDLLLAAARPGLVVADRLPARHRRVLDDAGWGWWDRRGALSVPVADRRLRRDPAAVPAPDVALPAPLERPTGRLVALHLLEDPTHVPSVRSLAVRAGTSTGAAGRALTELRELGQVRSGRVVDPDLLLAAVAAAWRPRWHPVRFRGVQVTSPQQAHLLGLDGRAGGWRRVGTSAAVALGAPRPAGAAGCDEQVERVLVPDERALAWLLRAGPPPDPRARVPASAAADVDAPDVPVLVAVAPRPVEDAEGVVALDRPTTELPVASGLEVALSLAAERAAGGGRLLERWRDAGWPLAW